MPGFSVGAQNYFMTLESLIELYSKDGRVAEIVGALNSGKSQVQLIGLHGSVDAFIASAIFRNTSYNHLFVCADREDASNLQENLHNILPNKDLHFFPDSFKKPGKYDELSNNNMLMRTETVNRISQPSSRAEMIITYPEALLEKAVKADELRKGAINVKVGEQLDTETLVGLLSEYGFDHVDFVYEPGQYAVRGGIIDIFSFANEYPYRVELFDQDVESIRTFDIETQLSEKKISSISIVPNIRTHFTNQQKDNFLAILPKNTLCWFRDLKGAEEIWSKHFSDMEAFREKCLSDKSDFAEGHFLLEEALEESLVMPLDLSKHLGEAKILHFGVLQSKADIPEVHFKTSSQPSFNKKIDLLVKEMQSHMKEGFQTLIFSDNNKQIERFYNIFQDMKADVEFFPIYTALQSGFIDEDLKLLCFTDHQIFNRFHKYAVKQGFTREKAMIVKSLKELQVGDFVTHIDHGVGKYSGLEKIMVNGQEQEAVRLIYADGDMLYVSIHSLHKISKYSGKEGQLPKINKLGSEVWQNLKNKTKAKIKDIAEDLIKLYAKRKNKKGHAFPPDSYMQTELEASFIYEDTPDQLKATIDVKADMEAERVMDRLVCGDVGFGKTEIAIRAAFKAVLDGKQVAVLVPTTILAHQHFFSFKERLDEFKVSVDYVNRFRTSKEKTEIYKQLSEGKVDILIGTQSLIGKQVKFKDLGLLIIDEEHKFGVAVKEKLKEMKLNVDTLTLTATPIPRTLQFSLMGARDLSVINTPPANRQPVQTEVKIFHGDTVKEAIEYEIYRGGQVFFVHNRVKDIMEVKGILQKLCPDVTIDIGHGQMEGEKLEEVMLRFINRESDVLLCTNIIESGLNVPNANTIIINNAHHFGLSDLHQLRGRVGRSNKKAFCYLLAPAFVNLTQEARQRLRTIEEFADLGSGFNISMRDLDIRGAGNILGSEQSGFISDIGYDMFHKILDEAIRELKETSFKDLYKEEMEKQPVRQYAGDCQIDTDLEMLIPDKYINSIAERMSIYGEMNKVNNEVELEVFRAKLIDRFGRIPKQVDELFNGVRIKWLAKQLGMERIIFKNRTLKCFFVESPQSAFYESSVFHGIMGAVQLMGKGLSMKQAGNHLVLTMEGIVSMQHAFDKLAQILAVTQPVSAANHQEG